MDTAPDTISEDFPDDICMSCFTAYQLYVLICELEGDGLDADLMAVMFSYVLSCDKTHTD